MDFWNGVGWLYVFFAYAESGMVWERLKHGTDKSSSTTAQQIS